MNVNAAENSVRRSDRRAREQTMRISTWEGVVSLVALGLQVAFFIPFLAELGATNTQIGFGASLPALITALIQFAGPVVLQKAGSYRRFVTIAALIHGICFVPLALIAFLKPGPSIWLSIAFMCLASIPFGIQMSAWSNWMSHIVPRKRRGKYFGRRTRYVTISQLITTLLAGYLLDQAAGKAMLMFGLLWLVAFAARSSAAILLAKHYEPPLIRDVRRDDSSFRAFLKGLRSSMFGRFALAISVFNFTVHIAVPFFPKHMIDNLQWSYMSYSVQFFAPTVVSVFCVGLWGRFSDRVGYVMPMRICVLIITAAPLVWVLSESYTILLISNLIVGVAWAGFNLTAFNYSISSIEPARRNSSIAYMNSIIFLSVFGGATLGGLLAPYLPRIAEFQVQTIFLVSALLRVGAAVLFANLEDCERYSGALSPVERIFFDPRLSVRTTLARAATGLLRWPF